jgi:hypothetical protein
MYEFTAEIAKIAENTNDETLLGDHPCRGVTYESVPASMAGTNLFEMISLCVLCGEMFELVPVAQP